MDKLSYTEIVKLIHPDLNPEIQDASLKMTLVQQFKDDEETLYKLAASWGLIEIDLKDSKNDLVKNRVSSGNPEFLISIGNVLNINGKKEIIVDVIDKENFIEIITFIKDSDVFNKHIRKNRNDQDLNFYVENVAGHKEYENADYKFQLKFRN